MQCAIYCRLSKEDEEKQAESESIQNQKSILIKYAVERGWDIFSLYCDEDYSGADRHRPDFCRMLRDAEGGAFQIVLCKSQSRFTRDMELVEKYIHGKFPLWGIRFVAIADNVDTDVKGNKKARQINGLINEWYLEDLSENIRMVFDHKRKQGQYIGGFPIYGYQKDPLDKNKLVVDPEAAAVVRQMFTWYLAGNGKQHIAHLLNQRGLPNPTKYKQEKGLAYHNGSATDDHGLWNKTSVGRILCNEMYTGVMVQGRRKKVSYKSKALIDMPQAQWFRVEGTHEAIIQPEVFQRVQTLMRPRVKTDGRGELHPLAGLVRCMDCGSTMSKTSNGQTDECGRKRAYLRCKLYATGGSKALCTRHSVRLDCLVEAVAERLRVHVAEYYERRDLGSLVPTSQSEQQTALLEKEAMHLQAQIEKRTSALKSLYLDKVGGIVDEEQFLAMNHDFLAEKRRMELRQHEIQSELDHLQEKDGKKPEQLVEEVEALLKLETVPRALFVMAIEEVRIGEKDLATGHQSLHIQWKF